MSGRGLHLRGNGQAAYFSMSLPNTVVYDCVVLAPPSFACARFAHGQMRVYILPYYRAGDPATLPISLLDGGTMQKIAKYSV